MARGIEGNEVGAPKTKKTASFTTQKSDPKQKSIAGFFQKTAGSATTAITPAKRASDASDEDNASAKRPSSISDAPRTSREPASSSPQRALRASQQSSVDGERNKENGQ